MGYYHLKIEMALRKYPKGQKKNPASPFHRVFEPTGKSGCPHYYLRKVFKKRFIRNNKKTPVDISLAQKTCDFSNVAGIL